MIDTKPTTKGHAPPTSQIPVPAIPVNLTSALPPWQGKERSP
jgi:hypothetical protein